MRLVRRQTIRKTIVVVLYALGVLSFPRVAPAHPAHEHPGRSTTVIARTDPGPALRPERSRRPALELMVTDLTQAVRSFAESLTPDQRTALLHPLEAAQRTTSRNAAQTPAFCAVLAWCVPGWGLETGALSFEQRNHSRVVAQFGGERARQHTGRTAAHSGNVEPLAEALRAAHPASGW